jgi:hypothetical protein
VARAAWLLLVISACYSPREPDCGFFCGPGGSCPADYFCADDGRCHREGSPDTLICPPDAAVAADSGDLTPPRVQSTSPTNGATDVALDAPVTVVFDEPVLGVDATSFSANQAGTVTAVSATEYTLTATWPAGTQVTVQLTAGIHDAAGNALVPVSFAFTTMP